MSNTPSTSPARRVLNWVDAQPRPIRYRMDSTHQHDGVHVAIDGLTGDTSLVASVPWDVDPHTTLSRGAGSGGITSTASGPAFGGQDTMVFLWSALHRPDLAPKG